MSYDWILEDIRRLRAKRWKTKEDEAYLKELYELRDALQEISRREKKVKA